MIDLITKLTERQFALHSELGRRKETLADMYLGALIVLQGSSNPDYLAQAAHSIRELMEKLPKIISVSMRECKNSITTVEMKDSWQSAIKKTSCHSIAGWGGEIDPDLRKFLQKAEIFFENFNNIYIPRPAQLQLFLRELDGVGRLQSAELEKQNIKIWNEIRDYFVNVAHHRIEVDNKEFYAQLALFEDFILDKLHPETIADFESIDMLIQEGEGK